MRHVWIDSGLPQPLVNPKILDANGRFIVRVDLLDPVSGLVGEYDGTWHRGGVQPWKDVKPQRLLGAVGATVANIGGPDFEPDLEVASVLRSEYLNARTHGFFSTSGARVVPQTMPPR